MSLHEIAKRQSDVRWKYHIVLNRTQATTVCQKVMLATRTLDRMRGLLGQTHLEPRTGLLIDPCSGVHTWGMLFPIDIVALDDADRVVGLWSCVGPYRVKGVSWKTRRILELAAGALRDSGTQKGDHLSIGAWEEPANRVCHAVSG